MFSLAKTTLKAITVFKYLKGSYKQQKSIILPCYTRQGNRCKVQQNKFRSNFRRSLPNYKSNKTMKSAAWEG